MLLFHQTGSVKVGDVVRYKLTYTPALDRILPPPTHLHVRIKNTSAIPLRAAYLHGPYTLYVAAYPSTFDPNTKQVRQDEEGGPDYEPQLKAGGHWTTKLKVPEEIRENVQLGRALKDEERKHFTWIIEVASQVLFSKSAAVHFELLVGRDENSIASRLAGAISMNSDHGLPGKLEDLQKRRKVPGSTPQNKGLFSKALRVLVDDTESLWNEPPLPSWDANDTSNPDLEKQREQAQQETEAIKGEKPGKPRKQRRLHLVILTHGLHSNLGADMLYMKESIDMAARQAKEDAKQKRAEVRAQAARETNQFGRPTQGLHSDSAPDVTLTAQEAEYEDEEEEDVVVRGFNGNSIKTERGIQYLGKRMAKYVLSLTYPDQPYLPVKSSISKTISRSLTGQRPHEDVDGQPTHKNSTIVKDEKKPSSDQAYRVTSISFVGHSLGGLVQTYAIAYIQKHSPEFFDLIKPVNFIAMATPFLGLSNENPVYVKFALDFGLVGRTGQDLGLTWRAPTIARSGWGAMVNGLVNDPQKEREPDPGAKPLLRILPTGPAHSALKKFRNRTVYSNVVNDGIVPLRTSCLLFLDWRGLGRVEKARRDNGLIGTMMNWGFNEMLGHNASTPRRALDFLSDTADSSSVASDEGGSAVPQPETSQDPIDEQKGNSPQPNQSLKKEDTREQGANPWYTFLNYFKPQAGSKPRKESIKSQKIYRRGQTMKFDDDHDDDDRPVNANGEDAAGDADAERPQRGRPVRGSSLYTNNSDGDGLEAPPTTTVFESAGDLLSPPLPPKEFLSDPSSRPRTIFHDRVYHPDDIPTPPVKRQRTFMKFNSSKTDLSDTTVPNQAHSDLDRISSSKSEDAGQGSMKIEEKIARAYHKDMSWRKVLVRLEPDAHNNMIVRRMFANAYGWPVVKHMCDTHFAFTKSATTRDEDEASEERAKPHNEVVGGQGEQVKGQVKPPDDKTMSQSPEHDEHSRRHTVDLPVDADDEAKASAASPVARPRPVTQVMQEDQKIGQADRSPSEIREAHDQVGDLVSMVTASGTTGTSFSNMHSSPGPATSAASAALNRLVRSDSARWSDRFFEGTDDESSDDDFDYAQGRRGFENFASDTPEVTSQGAGIDRRPVEHVLDEDDKLVKEPEPMRPRDYPEEPVLSTAVHGLGLGTNIPGQVATSPVEGPKVPRGPSAGIAEQVAFAQAKDDTKQSREASG